MSGMLEICTKFTGYELWDDINYSIEGGISILDGECPACDDIVDLLGVPVHDYAEDACELHPFPLEANQCVGFRFVVIHVPTQEVVQSICAYAIND